MVFFALIVAAAFAFAYFYEEEVKAYAIKSLNAQLQTEVNVGDVHFSVLKTFPMASLEFKDVSALESWQKTKLDTLFFAQSIFLKFNVWDIYNQDYKVRELEINNAKANLKIDEAGTENFNIWESKKENGSSKKELSFQLGKVVANNMDFHYQNKIDELITHLKLKETYFTGDFEKSVFAANIDSDFFIEKLSKNGEAIFAGREIRVLGKIAVNTQESHYQFQKTSVHVDGIEVLVDGSLNVKDENYLDITFSGKNIGFEKALALLNDENKKFLTGYHLKGKANLEGNILGKLSENNSIHIEIDFDVQHASIKKPSSKLALENIQMTGSYSNGAKNNKSTSSIHLTGFSAHLGEGQMNGELKIENFEKPFFSVNSKMNIQLAEISHFFDFEDLKGLRGKVSVDVESKGRLEKFDDISVDDWKNANSMGNIEFSDVSFDLENRPQQFKDISGKLKIVNNSLLAEKLQGNISNSDFSLSGKFINLIGFLLVEKQPLMIDASFSSHNLELDELLLSNERKAEGDEDYLFSISDRINIKLDAKIGHLNFKKFSFENCQSNISIKNQVLLAKNIHFESMGGTVDGSLEVDARSKSHLLLRSNSSSKNINVKQLFHDFNNFDQEVLTSGNLEGVASADIDFYSKWSPQLELDKSSLVLESNFLIEKGRLLNFDPLHKLSKYISLEELNDISFSSLQNNIQIKDERVFIPEFEIRSSAMDLSLEGSHSFDNQINYQIELIVDQLLGMKIKKPKKVRESEFGYVEDDGLGRTKLFLKMTGNLDNPNIGYDTKQLKDHWKEETKKEKQEVKRILNEEFGIFKDSAEEPGKINEEKNKKNPFQIEWGASNTLSTNKSTTPSASEEEIKGKQKSTDEQAKRKEKSGFSKFFDKIAEPNKDEFIQKELE